MNRPPDPAPHALKADSFGCILLIEQDGQRFVRRDLGATPWWLRLPAWWLARREARALAHLDGMTYAEIAAELGTTTHSVKKYLSKANLLCFFAVPDFAAS